jgi:hypothetical protein
MYIMRFKTVIGSTTSQRRECVFGFKTEQSLPNEEMWKLAVRNVLLQLKPNEYMESLKLESVTTE